MQSDTSAPTGEPELPGASSWTAQELASEGHSVPDLESWAEQTAHALLSALHKTRGLVARQPLRSGSDQLLAVIAA